MGRVLPFRRPEREKNTEKSDFDARMSRIKESLEKINQLMRDLKKGSQHE